MVAQLCEYTETTKLYALRGRCLWLVNCNSINHVSKILKINMINNYHDRKAVSCCEEQCCGYNFYLIERLQYVPITLNHCLILFQLTLQYLLFIYSASVWEGILKISLALESRHSEYGY